MKLNQDFVLREVAGETILIPVGAQAAKTSGLVTLNETGKTIWQALSEQPTYDYALHALLEQFDVSEAEARQDLDAFIQKLSENELLEA